MNVLFAATEASPFAKVGGLGDVVASLPPSLRAIDCDARIIMPKYRCIPSLFTDKMKFITSFEVLIGSCPKYVGLFSLLWRGSTVYFIDNEEFFGGDGVYSYGGSSEPDRTVFLCHAIIEALPRLDFMPDIINCNDWQTALIPAMLKKQYPELGIKTVMTIHNLKFQGDFSIDSLKALTGLGDDCFTVDGFEFYGRACLLKGGILFSDAVNTVSPTYANEVCTPEYGERLDGVLRSVGSRFSGILNGIDSTLFNPSRDTLVVKKYSYMKPQGKAVCREKLCEELSVDADGKLLVALIARLTEQKGLDIFCECAPALMESGRFAFVVLGTGEKYYEDKLSELARRYPGSFSITLRYDEPLAHRIYSGADVLAVPSKFEPCGLTQMIAMRYGTLPLVRETGGLRDSVVSYNEDTGVGFGFSFAPYAAHDLEYTFRRAEAIHRTTPELWAQLSVRAMRRDYSWRQSAKAYLALYNSLIEEKK